MVRSTRDPGKGFVGCHRVSVCPKKGVAGVRESWGPRVLWERVLQNVGCGRVCACPRKGVAGVGASRGMWTPEGGCHRE